ncbi:MAG: hypothetical protein ABIK68_12975, partial [bacterium]
MKFRAHLIGGITAGVIVVGIAAKSGIIARDALSPSALFQIGTIAQSGALVAASLFLLTLAMSLFPDLDTASVPQRWFFRTAFILLVILLVMKQMGLFACLTFILLLPLLHRHRGWTHSKWTPFAISRLFIAVMGYMRLPRSGPVEFSLAAAIGLFREYWIVILACVSGHYTHLLLDA